VLKIGDFGLARVVTEPQNESYSHQVATRYVYQVGHIPIFASLPIMSLFFGGPLFEISDAAHRWYRAPELLFGARWYGLSMDLWAVGAIFGELCTLCPLFPGRSDMDQVFRVLQVMGTATHESWPVRTPPLITAEIGLMTLSMPPFHVPHTDARD
jgi:serine/threonine protein kinase